MEIELDEKKCKNCMHSIDIECYVIYECELTGERHYANDSCDKFEIIN